MFESHFNIDKWSDGSTFIHNVHPCIKVIVFLLAVFSNTVVSKFNYSLSIIILFTIILFIARVNFKYIFKAYLFVLYLVLGLFISYGIFVGFTVKVFLTLLVNVTSMSAPVFYLLFTSPILSTLYGFECLLSPLKYVKIPVNSIILICTIALSFIPILISEIQRILYAMAARGLDIRYVKMKKKAKIIISLLIPLLISTLRRCETLGNAIVVKNYNAWSPRTNILSKKIKIIDFLYLIIVVSGFSLIYVLLKK